MKYDSSMTRFHENITAALRHMLGNNSEITKKFSPNDGSPAPLRDYLKEKYGKSYTSHIGDGMRYSCKASTGFELTFDTILNNPGDKNLTLSWPQVAKFIRDNWDEVFSKAEPQTNPIEISAEKQPSYFDKLREKYPKISIEDKWLFEDYCPYEIFTGVDLPYRFTDTCIQKNGIGANEFADCNKCWNSPCANGIDFRNTDYDDDVRDFEDDYFEHYPAEDTADAVETVPEISEEKSETGKPKPTYKDVFLEHYPDFDVGQFDEFIFDACLSEFFDDRGSTKCPEHHDCKICWYSECKHKWDITEEGENDIKPYRKVPPVPADTERDKPPENQIVPQDTSELSNTFNYAVLSTEMGDYLKHKEQQLKNEYMNFTANCGAIFAEAQERLAKHGFGENNGLFEKWITSIGFNKQTVYNMISVYNFRSSKILTNDNAEIFDSLSKSLQYEIAKPSAPPELVEQVLNGDITTHKEYIALKKQLEEANKRAETERKARESISSNLDNMEKGYVEFKDKYTEEYYKNTELEKRIKELESRPIDVLVDHNEVTKRVTEAVNKINSETEQTLAAREQEFAETLHFKDERIWELEDRLKEMGESQKVNFFVLSEDEYQRILAVLNGSLRKILENAVVRISRTVSKEADGNG